jgi:hemerythrin-like metal-binding protein
MDRVRASPYELNDAFLTGIKHLDDDHQTLVRHVNLIAVAEQSADTSVMGRALDEFKVDLAKHFTAEEAQLVAVGYPMAGSHAEHHSSIIALLDRLLKDVQDGKPVKDLAATCYHELVSVVLRYDMKFTNWLADRQMGIV